MPPDDHTTPVGAARRLMVPSPGPWIASLLVAMAGCGSEGGTGPGGTVEIVPPQSSVVVVGEILELQAVRTGQGAVTWASGDTAVAAVQGTASGASVEARRPGSVTVEARVDGGGRDEITVTVEARAGGYPAASIDYYGEIGFGAEYGTASRVVRRWAASPLVRLNGSPTAADLATLDLVMSEINALTSTVDMHQVESGASVEVYFEAQATFPQILPSYVPGNVGYFTVWWDASQAFTQAVVLISTDLEQNVRDHIIREEVTQILGLMRDSLRYPESIFYQNWSLVSAYAPVDEDVIEMLYREELPIGAEPAEAVRVLRRLTRPAPVAVAGPSGDRAPGIRVGTGPARGVVGLPGSASGGHPGR